MNQLQHTKGLGIKLYTFLLVLYYLLTMIFPADLSPKADQASERIYPQIIMGVIGIISLMMVSFNANRLINSKLCKPYFIYLIVGFIYIFYIINGTNLYKNFLYFLKLDMAILTLGTFYIFLSKNRKTALSCIYIIYTIQLIYGVESLIADRFAAMQGEDEIFNSNAGFSLITCLPMTMLLPKQRLKMYLYILLVLCCIASGQRSAALAAIITVPFTLKYFFNSVSKKDKYLITVLVLIACIPVAYFAITNIMMRNAIDAEKGDIGSGRSIFWLLLISDFIDHNLIQLLFGNGYFSPQQLLGSKYGMAIEAHNGWIQNLYVYGIIGLILYAKTVFIMLKTNKTVNKLNIYPKNLLLICFLVFFVKCSTSHGNWDISVMPFSIVLAMIADGIRRNKKRKVNSFKQLIGYDCNKRGIISNSERRFYS